MVGPYVRPVIGGTGSCSVIAEIKMPNLQFTSMLHPFSD
jgi:hypothetical protein